MIYFYLNQLIMRFLLVVDLLCEKNEKLSSPAQIYK